MGIFYRDSNGAERIMEITICFTRLSWYIGILIKLMKGNKVMAKNKKYILFSDGSGLEYINPNK